MKETAGVWAAMASAGLLAAMGCHSYHIETTVENRTGGTIELLEVDYPSASFGVDKLAAGAEYHYQIQLRGSGGLKVQYVPGEGREGQLTTIDGPAVAEGQEGRLKIVLLPQGKAEFDPELSGKP
jgi:hypothetical protein